MGASGLLSALIELTSQKQTLLQESDGTLHSRHRGMGAFNCVDIGNIQCPRRKGASPFERFITWYRSPLKRSDTNKSVTASGHNRWVNKESQSKDLFLSLSVIFCHVLKSRFHTCSYEEDSLQDTDVEELLRSLAKLCFLYLFVFSRVCPRALIWHFPLSSPFSTQSQGGLK